MPRVECACFVWWVRRYELYIYLVWSVPTSELSENDYGSIGNPFQRLRWYSHLSSHKNRFFFFFFVAFFRGSKCKERIPKRMFWNLQVRNK